MSGRITGMPHMTPPNGNRHGTVYFNKFSGEASGSAVRMSPYRKWFGDAADPEILMEVGAAS
jgi:hypothetical protein